MSMYNVLRSGGRKSNMTMLVMFVIIIAYVVQYPQIIVFMVLESKGTCLDTYWVTQLPRMTTIEFLTAMVTLLGLFGATNSATYFSKNQDTGES